MSSLPSFTTDTAAKTGKSKRTTERSARIGAKLPQTVRDKVRGTKIEDNQAELLKLAAVADLPAADRLGRQLPAQSKYRY